MSGWPLLLHQRGIVTAPEQSLRQALEGRRHVPVVVVDLHGLRTVTKGKVDNQTGDGELTIYQHNNQAQKYIVANITHIGSTSGNLVGVTCTGRWINNGTRINRIEIFPDGGIFTNIGQLAEHTSWLRDLVRKFKGA